MTRTCVPTRASAVLARPPQSHLLLFSRPPGISFIDPFGVSFADTKQLHAGTAGSRFCENCIKQTPLRKGHLMTKSLMFTECLLCAKFWTRMRHAILPTKPGSNSCQPPRQAPPQAWGLLGLPTDHKFLRLERREGKPLQGAPGARAWLRCVLSPVVN